MTQISQEEIKNSILAFYENHEKEFFDIESKIEKIEKESLELFDKKVIAFKNKIVEDTNISDDDLEKVYLEGIENLRIEIEKETKDKLKKLMPTK